MFLNSPTAKRRCPSLETKHKSQALKDAPSPSKFVPRSLSVIDILKLGKTIDQTTTKVYIYSFDLNQIAWSNNPDAVSFSIKKEPFGTGGFRKAFKAISSAPGFCRDDWG